MRNKGCCGCTGYVASCRGYSAADAMVAATAATRLRWRLRLRLRRRYGGGATAAAYGGGTAAAAAMAAATAAGYGCGGGYGGGVPSYGCGGGVPHAGHGKQVSAASPNAATVVVTLPADAKLTIDGDATTSTSSVRTFETPELVAGKTYAYTLEATFQQDGKPVVVSKKVKIEAGKTSTVDLNPTPATGVARN